MSRNREDSRERPHKMVFRVDAEGAWTWKQRAAKRQMAMQDMFETAAELFALIPPDQVDQVRAHVLGLPKQPREAKDIADRAVMAGTEEEAQAARAVIHIMREGSGHLRGFVRELIAAAEAEQKAKR